MRSDSDSAPGEDESLRELFTRIMEDVAAGGLTFPPPFDLASTVALAGNQDDGDRAEEMFNAAVSRGSRYSVVIAELAPLNAPQARREIINTTVASRQLLLTLLETLLVELDESTP